VRARKAQHPATVVPMLVVAPTSLDISVKTVYAGFDQRLLGQRVAVPEAYPPLHRRYLVYPIPRRFLLFQAISSVPVAFPTTDTADSSRATLHTQPATQSPAPIPKLMSSMLSRLR
jgi:hypothetical protein